MENESPCLDADDVLAFATGRLSAAARAEALLHVDGCEPCRLIVAEIARDAPEPPISVGPVDEEELVDGRFRVLERLGTGAMGTVYRARDEAQGTDVALKILRPEADAARGAKAFARELAVGKLVMHPNVCRSFDAGEHRDSAYITMELVDGETLADLLSGGELSEPRATEILRAIADGLAAVHAAGIVHRDLKPANVLLDRATQRPIVTDFGLATKLESKQSRRLVGTPAYWAPEQARGEPATPASDVYSLGLIAYRLLARRDYSLSERAALDAVPRAHRAFVAACLASRPGDRPADGAAARALLNRRRRGWWVAAPVAAVALAAVALAQRGPVAAPRAPTPEILPVVAAVPPPPPAAPSASVVLPPPSSEPIAEKRPVTGATKPPVVHRPIVAPASAAPVPMGAPAPDPLFRH